MTAHYLDAIGAAITTYLVLMTVPSLGRKGAKGKGMNSVCLAGIYTLSITNLLDTFQNDLSNFKIEPKDLTLSPRIHSLQFRDPVEPLWTQLPR